MLSNAEYLRQRLSPAAGDPFYLILADLLQFVEMVAAEPRHGRMLDYGCGGSPYRSLFEGEYVRADIAENPDRDVTLVHDGRLPAGIGLFGSVLSSQVLEHVSNPGLYLEECRRVLAPDGSLILTTHGSFEDHPCPLDLWRWTAEGLVESLRAAGFVADRVIKLTSGPRAALFFLERELRHLSHLRANRNAHTAFFNIIRRMGSRRLHRFADKAFSNFKVSDFQEPGRERYIGLAVVARRMAE